MQLTLRQRETRSSVKLAIFVFFFTTQILDVLTTTIGMSTGLTGEGNPIVLALIEAFSFEGAMLIKLLVTCGLAVVVLRFNLPHLVVLGSFFGLIVVFWNLLLIGIASAFI